MLVEVEQPLFLLSHLVFTECYFVTSLKVEHQGPQRRLLSLSSQTGRSRETSENQPLSSSVVCAIVEAYGWVLGMRLWFKIHPAVMENHWRILNREKWVYSSRVTPCCRVLSQSQWIPLVLASVFIMSFSFPKCPSFDSKLYSHIKWLIRHFQAWNSPFLHTD